MKNLSDTQENVHVDECQLQYPIYYKRVLSLTIASPIQPVTRKVKNKFTRHGYKFDHISPY